MGTLCNTLENESKTMRKISGYLIFVVFLFSCSSTKIADSEIQKLNGKYDANSIQSSTNRNENFIKLLNRQLIRDSLNYEILPYFKFELKVKNKNHLIINKINGENADKYYLLTIYLLFYLFNRIFTKKM